MRTGRTARADGARSILANFPNSDFKLIVSAAVMPAPSLGMDGRLANALFLQTTGQDLRDNTAYFRRIPSTGAGSDRRAGDAETQQRSPKFRLDLSS